MNKNILVVIAVIGIIIIAGVTISGCISTEETSKISDNYPEIKDSVTFFKEITQIPRPTGHEEKMREYLISFAKEHNFNYKTDTSGNILLTPKDNKGGIKVILQGHMDMVPSVIEGKTFDFTTQPLNIIEENGIIRADGTSLGADNGAGIANILSILSSSREKYPKLEISALFTVEEENGCAGANNINPEFLDAKYLINLDHGEDDTIVIGSAGNTRTTAEFSPEWVSADNNLEWYKLTISGLKGGHSGLEIENNRANALKIAAGFLEKIDGVEIASINGGEATNSIPSHAEFILGIPLTYDISKMVSEYQREILNKYRETDSGVSVNIEKISVPSLSLTKDISATIVSAMNKIPNYILTYDENNNVQTSSNIGIIKTDSGKITIYIMTRSFNLEELNEYTLEIVNILKNAGAKVEYRLSSTPWRQEAKGELIESAVETYKESTGNDVRIIVTHSGLETGKFSEISPEMQIISTGPTVRDGHTFNESLEIASLQKVEKWIQLLLERLESKTA